MAAKFGSRANWARERRSFSHFRRPDAATINHSALDWLFSPATLPFTLSAMLKCSCNTGSVLFAKALRSGSCDFWAAFSNSFTSFLWSLTMCLVRLVKVGPRKALQMLHRPLLLPFGIGRKSGSFLGHNFHQLLVGLLMILDHALAKITHRRIGRLLRRQLSQGDFHHSALRRVGDEFIILRGQLPAVAVR